MQSHKNVRWTFFAGKHQLLLASDKPTGDKSERYSSLTAAELVIAKKKKLADSVANAPQVFFCGVQNRYIKKKLASRSPPDASLKRTYAARPNPVGVRFPSVCT